MGCQVMEVMEGLDCGGLGFLDGSVDGEGVTRMGGILVWVIGEGFTRGVGLQEWV